jgi:hypothetical protein
MRESGVKNADVEYYGHQSRHARKGVYLPEAQINQNHPGTGAAKPQRTARDHRPILSSGKGDDLE